MRADDPAQQGIVPQQQVENPGGVPTLIRHHRLCVIARIKGSPDTEGFLMRKKLPHQRIALDLPKASLRNRLKITHPHLTPFQGQLGRRKYHAEFMARRTGRRHFLLRSLH
jgi:hypothetical protein